MRPRTLLSVKARDCNKPSAWQGAAFSHWDRCEHFVLMRCEGGSRLPQSCQQHVAFSQCDCLQVLTNEKNGYQAVQVGYLETRETRSKKPLVGHCKKAGVPPMKRLREFRVSLDQAGWQPVDCEGREVIVLPWCITAGLHAELLCVARRGVSLSDNSKKAETPSIQRMREFGMAVLLAVTMDGHTGRCEAQCGMRWSVRTTC